MAIELTCECGKRFRVRDELAGRRGKCPGCGRMLTIPAAEPEPAGADAALTEEVERAKQRRAAPRPRQQQQTQPVCSGCGKPMRPDAMICVHCGYNRISGSYMNVAKTDDAKEKKERAPWLTIAGVELRPLRVAIVVVPLVAVVVWYLLGPARAVHVLNVQTVSAMDSLVHGETREPYSLFTGTGDRSLGIKAPQSKSNPTPGIANVDEVYSMGGQDQLVITQPDPTGQYLLIEVALKQGTVREMEQTQQYDSVFRHDQFKLEPTDDGGEPITGRLLYKKFEDGELEIDTGGAQTTSYQALLPPVEPTHDEVTRNQGVINGWAYWKQDRTNGEIKFQSFYSFGDMPAAKGLYATGELHRTHEAGLKVDYDYQGGVLNMTWNDQATGWWTKNRHTKMTQMSPWHRFRFGLLFERPAGDRKMKLTYCGKPVATIHTKAAPMAAVAPAPTTTAQAPTQTPAGGAQQRQRSNPNSPLAYFDVLVDARNKARGIVASSNMRQIGLGLRMYLDQNDGQWPDNIEQLGSVLGNLDEMLTNPRTKESPGFIYEKPPDRADPAATAVLYEASNGQIDPDGAVLYADGHIEQK